MILKLQNGRTINYAGINKNAVENFKYIDKQLIKAGYGYIPRLAILGNIEQESKGDPLAESRNKLWHGIIQWNKDRYRFQSNNAQEELQRQTALLLKELEKTGWSGDTWRDQLEYAKSFKDSTDLRQAVDIFTRRFVRPGNIESEINKRYEHAQRGWMDEEENKKQDLEIIKRTLPDNLIQARRNMNNKVIENARNKTLNRRPITENKFEERPSWIPSSDVPSEDEIQSLISNAFKYQWGGSLIYKAFAPTLPGYKQETPFSNFSVLNYKFPVEPPIATPVATTASTPSTQTVKTQEPVQNQVQTQEISKQERVAQPTEQISEVKPQVDNTRVQQPIEESKGKIYKSSEKQKFQEDMYNAYINALKKRGLNDNDAQEFAKNLTTQDILESNWGRSSLSKDFNFGGVKDFSGKGVAKDTTEFVNGKKVLVKQPFRKFASIDDYVNYKINLVGKKWKVFESSPDKYYALIVAGPQKYATDPNYTSKLTNLHKQIWA